MASSHPLRVPSSCAHAQEAEGINSDEVQRFSLFDEHGVSLSDQVRNLPQSPQISPDLPQMPPPSRRHLLSLVASPLIFGPVGDSGC